MLVKQFNSFMTLVTVWMPSGVDMLGYRDVTSAHYESPLVSVLKSCRFVNFALVDVHIALLFNTVF